MLWLRRLKILFAVTASSFVASCVLTGEKAKVLGPLSVPDNYGERKVAQLTNTGINLRPYLSADGKRLLYVSGSRSTHSNFQAYERNLVTNTEKRITYQNGDVFEVQFSNNENRYVYSSSTDELKENPPYIEKSLLAMKGHNVTEHQQKDDLGLILPRTEIYRTTLDSSRIERVTDKPLFDGDISIRGKRHELVFVRWVKQIPSAFILNMKTENTSPIGGDSTWVSDPAYSPDGEELAWIEKTQDSQWHVITGSAYGKNGKLRHQSKNRIRDLVWSPKGNEVFFSEITDGNAELFAFQLETGCKRQISFHSALDFHPYPSPDASKLYFTSDRTGSYQIHVINLDGLPPCPDTKPTIE